MADTSSEPVKKTVRAKKTTSSASSSVDDLDISSRTTFVLTDIDLFMSHLTDLKSDTEKIDREINFIRQEWTRQQKIHEQEVLQRQATEELARKQDQESYEYEISLARKKLKDELETRRGEIESDKKELTELRKLVDNFAPEKDKAVKEAATAAQKELADQFETEKKLREQEVRSQIEVLNLKIASLENENSRQSKEIDTLKKSLEEATRQVKDIAIQVIQSKRPESPAQN